jgi:outer membrane immunogenic protein
MRKLVAVCAAFCALTLPAVAADVSVLGAYAPPPRPLYSWTGCRLGANIGGGAAPTRWNDTAGAFTGVATGNLGDHTASGVVGGGQLGCDYQVGRVVFGVGGLYDLTGMKANNIQGQGTIFNLPGAAFALPTATIAFSPVNSTFIQSTANITARIGYTVQPNMLLYAKAGIARNLNLYHVSNTGLQVASTTTLPFTTQPVFTLPPSSIVALGSSSPYGLLVGTGFEWALFGTDLSLFLEYDYMNFGTKRVTFLSVLPPTQGAQTFQTFPIDIAQNVNMVLFGINYRFYGGPPEF